MSQSTVTIQPGYKGTVSGTAAARFYQRATVSIQNAAGRVLALTTFVGRGESAPLAQEVNLASPTWSFGPFNEPVTVKTLIEHSEKGDKFSASKVIKPINVSNQADASLSASYLVSTIISEDGTDDDYTDCIVNILQYK